MENQLQSPVCGSFFIEFLLKDLLYMNNVLFRNIF